MKHDILRVMSYNVHSCIGRRGTVSPLNIAQIISFFDPDIIALQELDLGMKRTGFIDQAGQIANALNMEFQFHPSFHVEKGKYGNAVLSRFPLTLVRADSLPTLTGRIRLEKRGAIWTQVRYGNSVLQVVNTHLGLNRKERMHQVDALLGKEWLSHPECRPPIIFCADLNAIQGSSVYRKLRTILVDSQKNPDSRRPSKTWPSRFPFMRLDYIFISHDLKAKNIIAPQHRLLHSASDHLPVIAEIAGGPLYGNKSHL